MGRHEGFAVFVPLTVPGDVVDVWIEKVERRFARAEAVQVVRPSPARVAPPCPVADECGGCQWQQVSYEAQLEWKRRLVADALGRIGGLSGVEVRPVLGMESPWRYRNKVAVPFGPLPDGLGVAAGMPRLTAGFYRRRSHRIIPFPEAVGCLLQHPIINRVVAAVRELAEDEGVPPYDEAIGEGLLRHVVARAGFRTAEALAVLVINGESLPDEAVFAEELRRRVPELVGILKNINRERTNVILGERSVVLSGRPYLVEELGGLRFKVSATSFFQVNPIQAERLYRLAVDWALPAGEDGGAVIDAYCGTGAMALMAARRAREVWGVEEVASAIADAQENARLNGVENVRFLCARVEDALEEIACDFQALRRLGNGRQDGGRLAAVILDPPRKGCDPRVIASCLRLAPPRIVYVSCNPATLARDLRQLTSGGRYRIEAVQPVDMFPQTAHVECVVALQAAHGGIW